MKSEKDKAYSYWKDMKGRIGCGILSIHGQHKHYADVDICQEWLDFEPFYEWYESNIIDLSTSPQLDKDLFSEKNNKIYSPTTCCFLPAKINRAINSFNKGADSIICGSNGVYSMTLTGEKVTGNKEEINTIYITHRHNLVVSYANQYKNKLKPNVYNKLLTWYPPSILNYLSFLNKEKVSNSPAFRCKACDADLGRFTRRQNGMYEDLCNTCLFHVKSCNDFTVSDTGKAEWHYKEGVQSARKAPYDND